LLIVSIRVILYSRLKISHLIPATALSIYNYGTRVLFNAVTCASNLTVECLQGGVIICSNNTNITPIMKYDNASAIMKDRWDSTSTIHTQLVTYSPA
jgi:hypothetical protein